MSIIRITTLTILFTLLAALPSQTAHADIPDTTGPNRIEQFSCTEVTEIPQTECEALMAIYNPETKRPLEWLETTTPCSWSGVVCEDAHVTEIDLRYNDLTSLPAEIGNLSNLARIQLSGNKLAGLPAEIGSLENLTNLDVSHNELSSLPAEFGNLTNLERLNLADNQLSSLPVGIGSFTNLTDLSFATNQLRELPIEIGNLTNLLELHLHSNQLTSIPAEIGNLTNLLELKLSFNRLASLPAEIGNLTELIQLDLWANQLSSLPTEITKLDNLSTLDILYNRLAISISDEVILAFLAQYNPDWADTQTVAPTDVRATALGETSIEVTWSPIAYQDHGGYYEISVGESGTFTTASKSTSSYVIDGLTAGQSYDIRIRTYTLAHQSNSNALWSTYTPAVSATTSGATDTTMPEDATDTSTEVEAEGESSDIKLFLPLIEN